MAFFQKSPTRGTILPIGTPDIYSSYKLDLFYQFSSHEPSNNRSDGSEVFRSSGPEILLYFCPNALNPGVRFAALEDLGSDPLSTSRYIAPTSQGVLGHRPSNNIFRI